jgi:multidrug efflux system outer membrane protein
MSRRLALLVLVLGCKVGPDFTPPPPGEMPAEWVTEPPGVPPEVAEIGEWWKSFGDPGLDALVARALARNLDLQQAESRLRQARAARGQVSAGLWPEVDVNGSYRRARAGGVTGGSGGATNLFQAGLDATWELDVFGGTRRAVEAATADVGAATEDRRDVLVSVLAEVALNYVDLRGLQQQIEIARRNLATQEHALAVTQERYKGGFVSRLDTATAQVQVANTRASIPLLESAARQAMYDISVLLGEPPGALVGELDKTGAIPTPPHALPVGLPSDLLRRRPDIRRAEEQVHAATARIGVATADLYPHFSLLGSFGFSGEEASSLVSWADRYWSIGPSFTWPIFSAGRIRATIQVQDEIQQQALLAYRQSVLGALQDVENALISYTKEGERSEALAAAVAAANDTLELSTSLYTDGKTSFLEVLVAQGALLNAEDSLAQSQRSLAAAVVALYKALGGGWEAVEQGEEASK